MATGTEQSTSGGTLVAERRIPDPERDTSWMAVGLCREKSSSLFFPNDSSGVAAARRVCGVCPVKAECLAYALHHRIAHGVWGGTSERQRVRILRSNNNTVREASTAA